MTPLLRRLSSFAFLVLATPAVADMRRDAVLNQPPGEKPVEMRSQIVKLTDHGLSPPTVTLKNGEVILFLLNTSSDALATVALDYGSKATHCATPNMKIETNGQVHSSRPLGPKDFASVCFHDTGTYPLTVYGLPTHPEGIQTTVTVEP